MNEEEEVNLNLNLAPPGAAVEQAPAPPLTLQTLGYKFIPRPEILVTVYLNRRIQGQLEQIPELARNSIVELGENDFFSLNHNNMVDNFYYCRSTDPSPAWQVSDGPRFLPGNVGRLVTYQHRETNVRVKRYTSIVAQPAPGIAIYRITSRGARNLRRARRG